jgi:succinoglycan biosynthesis transport protein ExoP
MSGMRTLVVDADIFNSKITKVFAPDASTGLMDPVQNCEQVKEYIVPAGTARFDLLPATRNSNDILSSEHTQSLLKGVFQAYDIVIVDIPPSNPMVDWLAFSPLLDAVVVVAEWGRTPRDLLSEMLRSLRMTKALILGIIMTKVEEGSVIGHSKPVARYYS